MNEKALREQLQKALSGHEAHADWKTAMAGLPVSQRGAKPAGAPHSAWELLEHVRIAQRDILEFCRNPKHISPEWPSGYWPKDSSPPDRAAWDKSVKQFQRDTKAMMALAADPKTNLFAKISHGSGQTILRETLLIIDHSSYHLGQFVLLRRLLGSWPDT
jgi:uncharacterized damage-inducible protein DinB